MTRNKPKLKNKKEILKENEIHYLKYKIKEITWKCKSPINISKIRTKLVFTRINKNCFLRSINLTSNISKLKGIKTYYKKLVD